MPTFIHRNRLALAIAAFVLLDLGTLAFSYSISSVVEKDAVAINLAGRQRMLSQRITKAALLATSQSRSAAQRAASVAELSQSYQVFRLTLSAFAKGGETKGGDNRMVRLDPVKGTAALLVGEVQGMLDAWPNAPTEEADVERFSAFMDARNADILDSMNRLTTELEQQSIAAVSRLRVAQTLAFLLSLGNFVIILRTMHRARQRAEAESLTDALTGLRNRAGLFRELDAALQHCAASGTPLGVMLLDLDGFKAVNELNLYVEQNELRVVIGPNGSGAKPLAGCRIGVTRIGLAAVSAEMNSRSSVRGSSPSRLPLRAGTSTRCCPESPAAA